MLLAVCDGSVLRWRWRWSRAAPRAPRWQLHAVQALVLTPYFYGGLAKLNPDWLFRHEPVATWAPAMLQTLDDACGGALDAALPDEFDVITPFATFVSWGGLLFDLLVPFLLVGPSPTLRYGVAFPAALAFHACNRLWFGGLGVFPALCVVALVLFVPERTHRGEVDNIVVSSIPRRGRRRGRPQLRAVFKRARVASPEGVEACVSYYSSCRGNRSLRDEYSKGPSARCSRSLASGEQTSLPTRRHTRTAKSTAERRQRRRPPAAARSSSPRRSPSPRCTRCATCCCPRRRAGRARARCGRGT